MSSSPSQAARAVAPASGISIAARALVASTALLSMSTAHAESAFIDEVIVTGTKFNGDFGVKSGIPLEKLPQSVQVISAQDIAAQGTRSMGEVLRAVPGANAGYSRVGAYQSFSLKVRGFLADQMRNGMRQRYYEDVDASALSNIERVEVLKGPSGVLYGQSAVGGIVSIITKRPQEAFAASAGISAGEYDQRVISADVTGGVAPGLSLRATAEIERSGTFVDRQDMDRNNAALSLRYVASEDLAFNVVGEYVDRETQRYPGLPIPGTVLSNGSGELDESLYLGEPALDELTADAPLLQAWADVRLGENWTLSPRLQYQEFNSDFLQIRLRSPQADLTTINRNGRIGDENDEYWIGQLDLAGSLATGPLGHQLLLGGEIDRERARFTQYNLTNVSAIDVRDPVYAFAGMTPAAVFAFDQKFNLDSDALYVQDLVSLTDRWDAVGAVRHSRIDAWTSDVHGPDLDTTEVDSTIWQLGTTYRLTDAFSVYAGYNTGFDLESTAGARTADGDPLEPEESEQAEVGLRVRGERARGSISMFEIKRVNALTTDPFNPDFTINSGEQQVRGIEVEGEWAPSDAWLLAAGYAYLDSEITRSNDGDEGSRIGDVPEDTLHARAEYRVPGTGFTLRGSVNHVSERLLVNGSTVELDSYTLADLGASWRFEGYTIYLFASNLLDERYYTASGNAFAVIPGDPRSVGVRVGKQW